MKPRAYASLLPLVATLLVACANIQPALDRSTKANPTSGYIAGQFTSPRSGWAFVLREIETGKEVQMALSADPRTPAAVRDHTVALEVPPGRYLVTHFFGYAVLTKEAGPRYPVDSSLLQKSFAVQAGKVIHLGDIEILFNSNISRQDSKVLIESATRIIARPRKSSAIIESFLLHYPGFSALKIECLLCSD
jgi:hypothetical protein